MIHQDLPMAGRSRPHLAPVFTEVREEDCWKVSPASATCSWAFNLPAFLRENNWILLWIFIPVCQESKRQSDMSIALVKKFILFVVLLLRIVK